MNPKPYARNTKHETLDLKHETSNQVDLEQPLGSSVQGQQVRECVCVREGGREREREIERQRDRESSHTHTSMKNSLSLQVIMHKEKAGGTVKPPPREREFFIDNLLFQVH